MLSLRIAARFIRTSPGQSALIVAGIAVGIAVQVFVGSLIMSLQASLLETSVGSSPHVTLVNSDDKKPIRYSADIRSILAGDARVSTVVPVRTVSVVFKKDADSAPLNIIGAEPKRLDSIYRVSSRLVKGVAPNGSGIAIGVSFAKKYKLAVGDPVLVSMPGGGLERLRVNGVFDLGSAAANDRTAFADGDWVRRAIGQGSDEYSAIQLQLIDPFTSTAVVADWDHLASFRAVTMRDWQIDNKDLLTGLRGQSSSSYMIQVFVLVAVALGIASTLAISAVQKTRQIGILKALGLSDGRSAAIFVWQAAILGVGGTALGVGLGLALILGFQIGAKALFPIFVQPGFVAISAAVGVAVALASAIIPSRRTARVDPIEVIQGA